MAVKSLLIKDLDQLNKKLDNPMNYLDLDYNLIDPGNSQGKTHTRTTVLKGEYALLNAYRLWLQSRKYDYIRSPDFGGMFDSALNDRFPFRKESEPLVKGFIEDETKKHWPLITLLNVEVTAKIPEKNWTIHFFAQDNNNGLVLNDSASVAVN
jgi:hypothetical protein